MRFRLFLFLVLLPTLTQPAQAGILFNRGKNKKPTPAERVPELIGLVKADRDEHKRARAAEELRQYDPAAFPQIVPTLIEVLQNDKRPVVRAEAIVSLGKLRPVSQQAGMALEQALANDASMRVRIQARSALLGYHWAGYRNTGNKNEPPPLNTTKEPPVAPSDRVPPPISTREGSTPQPPRVTPVPVRPNLARPLPPGPAALTPPTPSTQEPPTAPPIGATPTPAPAPVPPPAPSSGPSLEGPQL